MIEVQNNNSRPAPIKGNHDRPALRADAEWLENLDPAPADGGEPFSVFETGTIRARPQVQAGLAIGKFVKEPFDEEARTNMFGQAEGISGAEVTAPNVIARSDLSAVARRAKAEATKQSSLLR